jgi:ribosomal protein S14
MMPQRAAKVPSQQPMMRILVRCSRTGRLFASGLTTKAVNFAGIDVADNKLACSFCGEVHAWSQENVVLGRIAGKSES